MYPVIRLAWQMWKVRSAPRLSFEDTHESYHLCLPWDLDIFSELNNGRTLTLYDLGRIPLGHRAGLTAALRRRGWGMTVAGSCPRYRRRITNFQRFRMTSRGIGWDDRFLYVEQAMWLPNGECAGHVLVRSAVTSKDGIVPPSELLKEMGHEGAQLDPPDWALAWIEAEAQRPWPPMQD